MKAMISQPMNGLSEREIKKEIMTEEQKEQLKRIAEEMYQILKPIIDEFGKILNDVLECVKEIVTTKVSVRTSKVKKGKKYIHSYRKYELWRLLI